MKSCAKAEIRPFPPLPQPSDSACGAVAKSDTIPLSASPRPAECPGRSNLLRMVGGGISSGDARSLRRLPLQAPGGAAPTGGDAAIFANSAAGRIEALAIQIMKEDRVTVSDKPVSGGFGDGRVDAIRRWMAHNGADAPARLFCGVKQRAALQGRRVHKG